MKKLLLIFISFIVALFSGCGVSQSKNGFIGEDIPVVNPLPDEDDEIRKKTYVMSNGTALRIRSGAGSTYSVLGNVDSGDLLQYEGEKGDYYVTTYKEKKGYVHKNYCTLIEFEQGATAVEDAISFGTQLLGYPYVWGSQRYHWGNGVLNKNFVNGEFDCSAFVQYIYYKTNCVLLDVTSRAQSLEGDLVKKGDLKRGDLMFFTNASRKNKTGIERVGHVGIYFGNNYILHTASDYAVIEPISSLRWSYYLHSRRVV